MEATAAVGERFHYINVPNKHSAGGNDSQKDAWVEMHISSPHFHRLRKLFDAIDPTGMFSDKGFVSIRTPNTVSSHPGTGIRSETAAVCVNAYKARVFEDLALAVKVSLGLLLLRLSAMYTVNQLLKLVTRLVAMR